jgi:hypothetical protein
MKKNVTGGLAAPSILLLFYLAVVHLSSCSSKRSAVPSDAVKSPINVSTNDTVSVSGGGTGSQPKAVINCITRKCTLTVILDTTTVAPGNQLVNVSWPNKVAIPDGAEIELRILKKAE